MSEAKKARIVSDGTSMGTQVFLDDQPITDQMLITRIDLSITDGLSEVTLHTDNVETDITIVCNEAEIRRLQHQILKQQERITELEAAPKVADEHSVCV